jgi:hypothetical protein
VLGGVGWIKGMMAVVEGRGEFRDIRCEKFTKV